jgi:DNA-directed RNA polymerase specialized sigma24 family protein
LEDLVKQGLSLKQIGLMLRLMPGEVARRCRAEGLPVPPEDYSLADEIATSTEEDPEDDVEQASLSLDDEEPEAAGLGTEPLTLEQEILLHHERGMAPEEIARTVSRPGAKVNVKKVEAVLKRFEADPEAFSGTPGERG